MGFFPVVGRKVAQAAVLEQLLPLLHRAGDVLRRVGVAAECDQLAAQLVIEPEPFAVRQGEMAAVGVALDAESLFDGAAHHMAQLLLVAVEIQLHAAQLLRPAQREGDVSEDLKAAPVDQLFHLLKVALAGGIPHRGIGARDPGEVVDLARGRAVAVDRADGEVQRRRVVRKLSATSGAKEHSPSSTPMCSLMRPPTASCASRNCASMGAQS